MFTLYCNKLDIPYDSLLSGEIIIQVKVKEFENPMLVKSSLSCFLGGRDARIQGLADLVKHNPIEINISSFRMLSSGSGSDENTIKLALKICANNLNKASSILRDNSLDPGRVFISNYIPPSIQFDDNLELPLPTSETKHQVNITPATINQPASTQAITTEKTIDQPKTDRRFVKARTEPTQTSQAQSQQTKQLQPNKEIDLALLDIDRLENGDISEVIGDFAVDDDQINATSIEELETIISVDVCPICQEDKASMKQHLISCTKCHQKYHTTCLKKDPIPYNSLSSMERRKRDEYVSVTFANLLKVVFLPID